MRRTDREITDAEKITQIIQTCHCCRLGFCDNGAVYIVPLNFGYAEENGKRVFYFHSAKSGRKLDQMCIRDRPSPARHTRGRRRAGKPARSAPSIKNAGAKNRPLRV